MAIIIYPDGREEVLKGTKTKDGALTLEQAQAAVEGWVEGVPGPDGKHIAVCNEEALYCFPEDQVNHHAIKRIAEAYGTTPDKIVPLRGPIVFVKEKNGNWY